MAPSFSKVFDYIFIFSLDIAIERLAFENFFYESYPGFQTNNAQY
jgi:hypothetical protein